jgi:hypothetical protein
MSEYHKIQSIYKRDMTDKQQTGKAVGPRLDRGG